MANIASKDRAAQDSVAGQEPLPSSYEAGVSELESLVARMEDGTLSLEESLVAYRRGAALVTYCQQQLELVEEQVRVLDGATLKPLAGINGTAGREDALEDEDGA
jgi:exodeoxyribonuclease VII small subunit